MLRLLIILAVLAAGAGPAAGRGANAPADADIAVDGGVLHVVSEGRGRTIVFIHGGFGDRRMWNDQARAFAKGWRVIRYDHRGFGLSPPAPAAYSPVDDLDRVLDHFGARSAVIVGNSVGGGLALDYALMRPERTDCVVSAASGANGYPFTQEDTAGVSAVFRAAAERGPAEGARLWFEHAMVKRTSRDPRTRTLLKSMIDDNQAIFSLAFWPVEKLSPATFERAPAIRPPALFIIGADDIDSVRRAAMETQGRMPGARLVTLKRADHLPQMARPRAFNAALENFVESAACAPRHSPAP